MRSWRSLWREPGYVALSLITLMLAVGANLVVFTIVDSIWIRPRPVRDPERVVMVMGATGSSGSSERFWFAEMGLQREVRDAPAFELVAGQVMTSGGNAEFTPRIVFDKVGHSVETLGVTSEYFSVLGLSIRGRDFTRNDDRYGAEPVAVISDRLWRSAFDGRADVIGTLVPATPTPVQIIGVAPAQFQGARLGENADLWIPRNLVPFVSLLPRMPDGSSVLVEGSVPILALARLRPGVTPAEAERLVNEQPKTLSRLIVVPLASIFGAPDHRTLVVNEGAVLRLIATAAALVLVGGCATLMALVFVHYERRRNEFAVRLALGASAARLSRLMASELAWLAGGGWLCAGLAASWSLTVLPKLRLPGGVNLGRLDLRFDWRVVVAGLAATTLTMLIAAALPMRRFTVHSLAATLTTPGATSTRSSLRLRQVMLFMHVAATVSVLAGAGLFVRTIRYGFAEGPRFDTSQTVFVEIASSSPYELTMAMKSEGVRPPAGENRAQQIARLSSSFAARRMPANQRIVDSVRRLPGVQSVAIGGAPLGVDSSVWMEQPRKIEAESREHLLRVGYALVNPEFSNALGLRLSAGRNLIDDDANPTVLRRVVITASLADKLWPGLSPLGRHFRMFGEYEVVGIVDDFAFGSLRIDPRYVILSTTSTENLIGLPTLKFVVRTAAPEELVAPLRQTLSDLVPNAARIDVKTGNELVAADLGRERLGAFFFSGFGLVAAVLGVGSVFGLVAYLAETRRREFGIRAALGATTHGLTRLAITAGLAPAALGTCAGLIAALGLGRAARSFLIGVPWFDPVSYLSAGTIMLAGAFVAGMMAAWRIRRIEPAEALRSD